MKSTSDRGFALAYVGLADAFHIQFFYGYAPRAATLAGAAEAIRKALELDPNLAEAHTSLAKLFEHREDTERAELEYRKAIELNPNYATVHHWYALMLAFQGRFSEALQEAEKAEALDPLSAIINNMVAIALAGEGRFEEALAGYRKAIQNDPAMPVLYGNIAALQAFAYGRFDKAVPWDERATVLDPDDAISLSALGWDYLHVGDDAGADRWLKRAMQHGADNVYANDAMAEQSRVVGFGGRVMDDSTPKYLNSPETPVYVKRRVLYGLNRAREACRAEGTVYIVEGSLDLIALHQHGILNAAATLGTALSPDHIHLLARFAGHLVLVYDTDEAGIRSAQRCVDLFWKEHVDFRRGDVFREDRADTHILVLPDGHDPDSFVFQHGADEFRRYARTDQKSIVGFLMDSAVRRHGLSTEEFYWWIEKTLEMKPTLTLDDGADLIFTTHKHPDLARQITGAESKVQAP